MRLPTRLSWSALRHHLPPRTIRFRLTALYSALFMASAAALLCFTDLLWGKTTVSSIQVPAGPLVQILRNLAPPFRSGAPAAVTRLTSRGAGVKVPGGTNYWVTFPGGRGLVHFVTTASPRQQALVAGKLQLVATQQQSSDLHHLLIFSGVALAVMVMIAVVLGWVMSGRILRPLRTITAAASDISATNLHERLELQGPEDELRRLGDTFDRLLERLEGSFESQRQFVANASHELRTPLTTMRASLDVAEAKPGPLPEGTVTLVTRLRAELDHVDLLLESFLALARAQRGPDGDETTVPLDEFVSAALDEHAKAVFDKGIGLERKQCPSAVVRGSETLLGRMVGNVIDNAVKHNEQGGWIKVRTQVDGAATRLVVENGGPLLSEESVSRLAQPFRRLGADRTGSENGTGLGLSIIAAVAEAHGGRLELHGLGDGGLQVVVELPLAVRSFAGAPM
jgi:signal transduction histidine kinase